MVIMFISMVFMVICGQFFVINHQIQSINKEIIHTPVELLSTCVFYDSNGVYFDTDLIEDKLRPYYAKKLERHINEYELEFYFYNVSDQSYCYLRGCEGVEVSLTCSLINNYQFHRKMHYEIKEGIYGQN